MQVRFFWIISLTVVVALASCERVLDIPFPEHEPLLVVNAFLNPDSPKTIVHISRSYGRLEDQSRGGVLIEDATIRLLRDNAAVADFTYRDTTVNFGRTEVFGQYEADYQPEVGATYRIEVSHPDYPTVRAETHIVSAPEIVSVEFIPKVATVTDIDGYSYEQNVFRVTIEQRTDIEQVYGISFGVEQFFVDPFSRDTFTFRTNTGNLREVTLANPAGYQADGPSYVAGKNRGQRFTVDLLDDSDYLDADFLPEDATVYLQVNTTTAEVGAYLEKFRQQASSGDVISLFPVEPIVVPNNIENGYGIFGSLTVRTDSL